MNEKLAAELKEAEAAVAKAEKELGANHPELAEKLQRYANLLRRTEKRALDAVNVEARARAIRAKILAEDEAAHGTKPSSSVAKPGAARGKRGKSVAWGMYFGFVAIFLALSALVVKQTLLPALIVAAVLLCATDAILSKSGYWRVAVVLTFALASWWCNASVPSTMLVDESPINRFNYASEFPDLVANINKLGKPVNVFNYKICLPDGYDAVGDETKDWGRVLTYSANTASTANTANAGQGQTGSADIHFIVMKLPEIAGHKTSGRSSLLKLARDFVVPHLVDLGSWQNVRQDPPRFLEINGMNFVKINFYATTIKGPSSGFAYVAALRRTLLVISCDDLNANTDDVMPLADAAVYTMKRVSSGEPELE